MHVSTETAAKKWRLRWGCGKLPRKETGSVAERSPRRLQTRYIGCFFDERPLCDAKIKTFLASPSERKTTDPDDFDGKHGLVNGKDGLRALSSVFAALRQLHLRALRACRLNRVFPLTRSFQCGTIFSAHII